MITETLISIVRKSGSNLIDEKPYEGRETRAKTQTTLLSINLARNESSMVIVTIL